MNYVNNEQPIVEISFFIRNDQGEEQLKMRVHDLGHGVSVVNRVTAELREHGGIWVADNSHFYPWHSIYRINWQRSELSADETQLVEA